MRIRNPITEQRASEKLYNYIHQKVDALDDYKWKRKTYAYKKLDVENCPYVIRATVRWDVDWRKTTDDKIDLTFAVELAISNMLLPIWELTFKDIKGINGIDSAFQKIDSELDDFREGLEF